MTQNRGKNIVRDEGRHKKSDGKQIVTQALNEIDISKDSIIKFRATGLSFARVYFLLSDRS